MGRPNQLQADVLEALRLIARGASSSITPERMQELVELGLVKRVDNGFALTFPGKYRLRMVQTDAAAGTRVTLRPV